MQKQQAKAREDIIRYCDALQLPHIAREEALQLFAADLDILDMACCIGDKNDFGQSRQEALNLLGR